MSVDITSLQIKVVSDGIKEASNSLSGLSTSAANSERRVTAFIAAMEKLNAISRTSSQGADSFMGKMREQANALNSLNANARSAAGGTNALASAMGPTKKTIDDARVASDKFIETLKQKTATLGMTTKQIKDYNIAQLEAKAANLGVSSSAAPMIQALRDANNSISSTARSQRIHNESMKEGHALARGLSGSLGALWVTYGNLAGMAVGLAIGASLKGIVTIGKDVEQTLESIRVKGQETVASVNAVREAVLQIGTGVYGPQEVAKAFETLILAGLNAKQALSGIKDALNLATVGGTTIEKSAYTLVQVGTALNYGAEGYSRIADVISKTAAVSMSSVESLSEAFKSGSSVGKLYGISLVDVGTSLAALSNLGIQGSAAGTSLKNMYKELASESDKVKNALKQIKLTPDSFKDDQGNFLNLIDVVKKLSDGLDTLKAPAQKKVLAELANERGMKNVVEVLGLYRTKIAEAGDGAEGFKNKLEALNKSIDESYGFAAIGAAAMALTVDAQFKSVKNSLETTLVKAFQDIQPELSLVATRMKAAFNSPEFISGIQSLATASANLAVFLVENSSALYEIVRAILAFKAASFVVGLLVGIAESFIALKTAMDLAKWSSIAFQASLGVLGIALAAGAAAFVWWTSKRDEATNSSSSKAALNYMDDFKGKLDEEAKRLNKQIELMIQGKTARDAETQAIRDQQLELVKLQGTKVVNEAEETVRKARGALNPDQVRAMDKYRSTGVLPYYSANEKEILQLLSAEKALQNARDTTNKKYAETEASLKLVVDAARVQAKLADEEAKKALKKHNAGTGVLQDNKKGKSQGLLNVNEAIAENALVYQENVQALEREITLDKLRKKYKMESAQDIYLSIKDAELKRIQFMQDAMDKDLKAAELYNVKDENLTIAAKTKKLSITRKYTGLIADANTAIEKARIESIYASQEPFRELEKAREKELNDINKNIDAISAQVKAYDSLPEAMKRAGVTEKQLQDNITQVKIDNLYKEREAIVANGDITDAYDQRALENINTMIAKQIEYRDLQFSKEMQQAQQKAIAEYNEAWKRSNKQYSDDLANAIIEGGGKGWKKMLNDMKLGFAKTLLQPILAPISGALATGTAQAQSTFASYASGNSGSGLSGMYNMYSAGKALWDGFSGGLTSNIGGAITTAGNLFGSSALSSFGAGISGAGSAAAAVTSGEAAIAASSQALGAATTAAEAAATIGSTIGAAIPWVAAALAVATILKKGFGHGEREIQSAGIEGNFSTAGGFSGNSFQKWKEAGGWFTGDRTGTIRSNLPSSTQQELANGFYAVTDAALTSAKNLGMSADKIKGYSQDVNIILTADSKANTEAINKAFSDMANSLAEQIIPNIATFAKTGETSNETITRLSGSLVAVNSMFDSLNYRVYESSLFGAQLASNLVDMFGSLSNMQSTTSAYFKNYYTEQERVNEATKVLSKNFSDLGLTMPSTKDELRKMIESLDLTTLSGQKTWVKLVNLSSAFSELDASIVSLTTSTSTLKAAANKDYEVLQKSIESSKDISKATFDAQTAAITAQKNSAEKVFNDTKTAIQATLDTAKTANTALSSLSSSLTKTLESMTLAGTEASVRTAAQNTITTALAVARSTGVLPTSEELSKPLSVLTQASQDLFATYEDYARDFQMTKNSVSDLNDLTTVAKSNSDRQVSALEDSLTLLQSNYDLQVAQFDAEQAAAQAKYDGEIAKYDSMLQMAQQQIDLMNGTYVAIKDLSSAMVAFAESSRAAINSIQASPSAIASNPALSATKPATRDEIAGLYQTVLGRAPDQAGLDWWVDNASKNNFTITDVMGDFYKSAEYQSIHGSHADGLDMVPFDNYRANLHAGERVLTAKAARDADSTAEEIRAMRMEINAALLSVAQNTGVSSKLMRQWDGDGIPPERIGT